VNRQTKRMMQRQGQLDADGSPVGTEDAPTRAVPPAPRPAPSRVAGAAAGPVGFVREIRGELRKVAWPTREEVTNYSGVVIVTLVLLVGFIFALNLAFSHAISALFGT